MLAVRAGVHHPKFGTGQIRPPPGIKGRYLSYYSREAEWRYYLVLTLLGIKKKSRTHTISIIASRLWSSIVRMQIAQSRQYLLTSRGGQANIIGPIE